MPNLLPNCKCVGKVVQIMPNMLLSEGKRFVSLLIAYVAIFLLYIHDMVFISSLWPYLLQMDPNASEVFFGYIVMSTHLSSAAFSPLFGLIANRMNQVRLPVIIGILFIISGNITLVFIENIPLSGRKWAVLFAGCVMGTGYSTSGVLLAYLAMSTSSAERNKAMALRSAMEGLAVVLDPLMRLTYAQIGYPGLVFHGIHLNMHTTPCIGNAIFSLVVFVLFITCFEDIWLIDTSKPLRSSGRFLRNVLSSHLFEVSGALICFHVRSLALFGAEFSSTLNSAYSMLMFGWSTTEAVRYNAMMRFGTGLVYTITCLVVGFVASERLSCRRCMLIGVVLMLPCYLSSFSWPNIYPNWKYMNTSDATNATTLTCNYSWCTRVSLVPLPLYFAGDAFLMASLGMTLPSSVSLFTKILGPIKQGTIQGVTTGLKQLVQVVTPFISSQIYAALGPRFTWGFAIFVVLSVLATTSVGYKRLVALNAEESKSLISSKGRSYHTVNNEEEGDELSHITEKHHSGK